MEKITARLDTGTRVTLSNDRHQWFADEPFGAGGSDTGPSPYELLLGSLAACTAVTVRLYAQHKGIDIPWMRLEYEHDREAIGEDGEPGELITARVTIGGEYTDAQRARLEQVVGRCRVHKTLANGVRIIDEVSFVPELESADAVADVRG